jgi:hypothetical protein
MSWVQVAVVASIVGGACAVGLSEHVITKRRARHAILVQRYNELPKRPDDCDDDDWTDPA